MVYLSSFALSTEEMKNPNIYPYCVFENKGYDPLVFTPITILYGDNGCAIIFITCEKFMSEK